MTIGDRIKEIRKESHMTLEKFGKCLGVGKTAVSNWENGTNVPEQMIISICREFDIRKEWLLDGDLPMRDFDDRYSANLGKLQRADDETIIRWINAIAETSPEALKQIEEFMKKIREIE